MIRAIHYFQRSNFEADLTMCFYAYRYDMMMMGRAWPMLVRVWLLIFLELEV